MLKYPQFFGDDNMSVYGLIFYVIALALGTLYGFFLIFNIRWALSVPDEIWEKEKRWVKMVSFLYAAVVFGMVVMGTILLFAMHLTIVKVAVGLGTLVMMGMSTISDAKWKSRAGLAIDFGVLTAIFLSLLFG